MTLKKTVCLLALTLFCVSFQASKSGAEESDTNAGAPAQNQTPPGGDSQQPGETVVPPPPTFDKVFVGAIDGRLYIYVTLNRKGADLTGAYHYERAGAFNLFEMDSVIKKLELKGRIDGVGNVTLTETSDETGSPQKTGEFKGKLDGLSANGGVRLRFLGSWTRAKDGKRLPFRLREFRFGDIEFVLDLDGPDYSGFHKLKPKAKGMAPGPIDLKEFTSEEVITVSKDFISVLYYYNYEGGSHPNTVTESVTYDLNSNARVKLADLFIPNSNYLKLISRYAIKELKKLETTYEDESDVEGGAGPKIENFHSWNITPVGLKITFDPYDVGPYVSGFHEVVVPYSVLKPIIKPNGLLARFAR
jgi:Protein of unknown function (DUF3298)